MRDGCGDNDDGERMSAAVIVKDAVVMTGSARRMLGGVSLEIEEKEHIAVCGPPGSGKNALMKIVAGISRPSAGSVCVFGKEVHEMDTDTAAKFRSRYFGIVTGKPGLMQGFSVLDNTAMPLVVQGALRPKQKEKAMDMLKAFGIDHLAHALPARLSAYEKLAAAMARSVIANPKILLLYEAACDLTDKEAGHLGGMLSALSNYGDYTILSFCSDERQCMNTDRTVFLYHGKIQEDK